MNVCKSFPSIKPPMRPPSFANAGKFGPKRWVIPVVMSAAIATFLPALSGQAAEKIVFRYGILRQSLSVAELSDFAETGEMSGKVERYLERINSNPQSVRQILTQPVPINHTLLDKALNNPAGNLMLDELGKMIQTPDDQENQEALRTALVKSTVKDNQFTLLEVVQNYPSDEIHLDVKRAIKTYQRLSKLQQPVQDAWKGTENLRERLKKQGIPIPDFLK